MKPNASLKRTSNVGSLEDRLLRLQRKDVLVGIPSSRNDRGDRLLSQAVRLKEGKRQSKLVSASETEIGNAELLYIHTHGSQLRGIPPRPVIEPAIQAPDNKANITAELKEAAQGVLEGRPTDATQHLSKAGQVGANAAKRWFTDPRNNWAPNAPQTIKRKGSDRPLIDTGELRRAITYVVEDK